MKKNTLDFKEKKAILFDSGKVLNQSSTGHWFITPNFFQYVDQKKFNTLPSSKRKNAFAVAGKSIKSKKLIRNENEEYDAFLEYYRTFAKALPELELGDEQIQSITQDYVYNYDKYTFFQDVKEMIPILSQHYKLAIVSDAWPSLEGVFEKAQLKHYFSSIVISSKLGVTKPNELMYQTALDELGLSPNEALFIDDNIRNCKGANKLGIDSILLCREWKLHIYSRLKGEKEIARSLKALEKLLL